MIMTVKVDNIISSSDNYLHSTIGSYVHIMAIATVNRNNIRISSSDGIFVPATSSDDLNDCYR